MAGRPRRRCTATSSCCAPCAALDDHHARTWKRPAWLEKSDPG
jgi:hypothetical protein